MGGKFLVSGDPFILQELQNSRVLSLQGLHRGEQVVKYLLHKIILVHIESSRNLRLDAKRRAIGEGVCGAGAPSTSSGQALAREKPISGRLAPFSVFRSVGWVPWVSPPRIPAKLF